MKTAQNSTLQTSFTTAVEKEFYLNPKTILNFTYGYPDGVNPKWIEKYRRHLPRNFISIAPSQMIAPIERYFQNVFRVHNVMLTPTASYAFIIAASVLIDSSSDEILVLDSTYDSYALIIKAHHGKTVYAERNPDHSLNIENIKKKCNNHTKAIVLCIPENPLGVIYSKESLEEVAIFCKEKEITLVIDYCFVEISPFGKEVPILTHLENIKDLSYILIGDTGKILGLQGSKFGALIFSENWRKALESVKSTYFFQYSQYDLYLISSILSDKKFPQYLKGLNKQVYDNYFYLKHHLDSKTPIQALEGSCFALIDVSQTGLNDIEFAKRMETNGVGLVPMSYFYTNQYQQSTLVRVSLARNSKAVSELVKVINRSVKDLG